MSTTIISPKEIVIDAQRNALCLAPLIAVLERLRLFVAAHQLGSVRMEARMSTKMLANYEALWHLAADAKRYAALAEESHRAIAVVFAEPTIATVPIAVSDDVPTGEIHFFADGERVGRVVNFIL